MATRFKYEPAGSIVGLAAYATGDNKARARSISRALSGRRYPSRTSRADTAQSGGQWIDPLDTFEGPEEARRLAMVQQRAQMNAFRRDPSRARKYGANGVPNYLPRWQSQAEVDQIEANRKSITEQRNATRKQRQIDATALTKGLEIPKHAQGAARQRLIELENTIRAMQFGRDIDLSEPGRWDELTALVDEYHSILNSLPEQTPNQNGWVLENGKWEKAGDRPATHDWEPGMSAPVPRPEYVEQKKKDQELAEKAAKDRDAELKAQKDAAEARVKERNDFQMKRYEHYLGLVGTEYTGMGPKPPTNQNEAMQIARADTDALFGQPGASLGGVSASSGTVPATTPIPPPISSAPAATPPDSSTGVLPWPFQQPAQNPQAAIPAAPTPQQTGWSAPTTPQTGPFASSSSDIPPRSGRTVLADIAKARAGDVNSQQALADQGIDWTGSIQSAVNQAKQTWTQAFPNGPTPAEQATAVTPQAVTAPSTQQPTQQGGMPGWQWDGKTEPPDVVSSRKILAEPQLPPVMTPTGSFSLGANKVTPEQRMQAKKTVEMWENESSSPWLKERKAMIDADNQTIPRFESVVDVQAAAESGKLAPGSYIFVKENGKYVKKRLAAG